MDGGDGGAQEDESREEFPQMRSGPYLPGSDI